jgi:pyruvate,orthophosphate dikinase
MSKYVYFFGGGKADGKASDKNLLGGKGANLAEMVNLGIPVPPGFTLSTEVCTAYFAAGGKFPEGLEAQVDEALARVEKLLGKKFGDPSNPLLFSVRSGARASMPGMMDTVLNLGLNDEIAAGLAKKTGNPRFVWDAYRRFITMYSDIVLGVKKEHFEEDLEAVRREVAKARGIDITKHNKEELKTVLPDSELGAEDFKKLVGVFKGIVQKHTGKPFPTDPKQQLWGAIGAVFGSWNNDRAKAYRKMYDIPESWGTACNVQSMVFGNLGDTSATGVAFTRDPSTGENVFYGEWLPNAQGEDVVAGIRTPFNVTKEAAAKSNPGTSLEEKMPKAFAVLRDIYQKLEKHYRDMMDIEFTIEDGTLYMLQCRVGKRTAAAAVRMAVEMAKEGLITKEEAVMRVDPASLDQLLHPTLDPKAPKKFLAKGLPASPGAAVGIVAFSAQDAEKLASQGKKVILVRIETSPEDIKGMEAAQGILTARGGMTSHAAVVARGMGKCCVAGCSALNIDYQAQSIVVTVYDDSGKKVVEQATVKAGEFISLDGNTGKVYLGAIPTVDAQLGGNFGQLMQWADEFRVLKVRTNADTPHDAAKAREFGAEGIGLCRTEHMFFGKDRIAAVREMILSSTVEQRKKALDKLLPYQREDFIGIFKAMDGLPVTIRTLDPPLHEFLPTLREHIEALAKELGVTVEELERKNRELHEANPMLGHRGVRLAISWQEIAVMQFRAILEAAVEVDKQGVKAKPEVMIPFAVTKRELDIMKSVFDKVAQEVFEKAGRKVDVLYGTMVELPRAALMANELAKTAEFFSFGTNDLTQTTCGLSRDDAGKFLPDYVAQGIFPKDPFQSLDTEGVGQLVEMACTKGRATRPDIKLGICGEHGGDPASIHFCHKVGLAYVSCSPFRVPIARLAAAQAAIAAKGQMKVASTA